MCMCVCPPPCLVSCTEQLPRESPCQKPRQNIKTCNTFCITVTQYTLFFFFLVINFKNKNPFSSKEKQDKTIEIYFSKKKKEKKKLSAPLPKTVEEEQGVCGGGGVLQSIWWNPNQHREMVSRVCVCIFFFCTYTGDRSVAQLTPAVLYVAEFFSFSINPPTKIRKGRNLCASKWVYFFPFILFFF